ncbi:MAG: iron ABC transporter permease, partial [Victivallaceae bacterium]
MIKILIPLLLLAAIAALNLGVGECNFSEFIQFCQGRELSEATRIIWLEIRLPRIIGTVLAGGMLAAAGCTAQNLFRNELASPHVLGVVNFAALGAVCGMFIGVNYLMPLSIIFGLSALLLPIIPARRRNWNSSTLILCGIAGNAFASAVTGGLLYLADERLNSVVFWLMGGCWRMNWRDVIFLAPTALLCWGVLFRLSKELDMLLLGDRAADLAGVPVKKLKPLLMFIIALLTAMVVSCCGVIGFVGLAIPHICRIMVGATFDKLLPASILSGG